MTCLRIVACALLLTPLVPARAAIAAPAAAQAAAPASPAAAQAASGPAARLEDLAFMAGCWIGVERGITSEECWMAPAGGMLVMMHRDLLPGGKTSFEFARIVSDASGIVYLASPRGAAPTPFRLAASSRNHVEFANPEHDYPQRIIYWSEDKDTLHARVEGAQGGQTVSEEWTWKRKP